MPAIIKLKNSEEILSFKTSGGKTVVDVKLTDKTVWLSLNQIAKLFERDKSVISRHLSNIFKEKELNRSSVVAFFATTGSDGKTYQG
jgi:hypothetical protein